MTVMTLGSTGLVGSNLLALLAETGHDITAITRQERDDPGARWVQADVNDPAQVATLPAAGTLISTVSIESTAAVARHLASLGLARIVAFSSTSIITKGDATDPADLALSRRLQDGEDALRGLEVPVTILRPTMVYGGPSDGNVARIAAALRRYPIFPLVGGGRGLRQPVHAGDLAAAAMQVLDSPVTPGRTYTVSGGERLSVRDMVRRVAEANGTRVRFVSVPLVVARGAARTFNALPRTRPVPIGAFDRMTKDMVFDHDEAAADFGYAPRVFEPPRY